MPRSLSRRMFFGKSGRALMATGGALGGGAFGEAHAKPAPATKGVNYYTKLGVTPFINAAGTYTILSASTMPEEV